MSTIYYDVLAGRRVTSTGALNNKTITLGYQSAPTWEIQLSSVDADAGTVTGLDLTAATAWKAAVDKDFNHTTDPMCRILNADIDSSRAADGIISLKVDANTSTFAAAVGTKEKISAYFELQGLNSSAEVIFEARFAITATNAIDPSGGTPPDPVGDYYSKTEVDALLQAATVYQFSADGSTSWHDTYASTDKYYRERVDITGSSWSAALPLGRSEIIIDSKNHSFSTTEAQAAAIEFTKTTLGIASDSEPQVSLWLVGTGTKTKVADSSYTAVWNADSLTITYYTTWSAGDWIIKMS